MDGEGKLTLILVSVIVVCGTVLYSFLFLALWDYRQWIGLSLLAAIIATIAVFLRGKLTEQDLRHSRYRHHEETPLDRNGASGMTATSQIRTAIDRRILSVREAGAKLITPASCG